MGFNWLQFVQAHSVEYVVSGKNVQKGHVSISCPFCAGADPSHHLSLSLTDARWRCWRDPSHCGNRPERLIQALRNCSWTEAHAIAGDAVELPLGGLPALAKQVEDWIAAPQASEQPPAPVDVPVEFVAPASRGPRASFWDYLIQRGFPDIDLLELCRTYDVRCALSGRYRRRIILPFIRGGKWYGWTARAIGEVELRYVSYPGSAAVKANLFNYDSAAKGGKILVLVEGAIGSLKVDFYGRCCGVRAAAFLGTAASPAQVRQALELSRRYEKTILLFDPGAEAAALAVAGRLAATRPRIGFLPAGLDGPDDLKPDQVAEVIESL